jgi:hypothetical protein
MILPDNPDASMTPHNSGIATSRDSSISGLTGHLGMGFLTSNKNYEQTNDSSEVFQDGNVRQHTAITDGDDPNILLNIIRELVEEAKEWDDSLFMDDKFKSMIQDSALLLTERNENKFDAKFHDSKEDMPPDRSDELDLGLIGVNIFQSDGETSISHDLTKQEHSRSNMKEHVSFWDDGSWGDEQRNM